MVFYGATGGRGSELRTGPMCWSDEMINTPYAYTPETLAALWECSSATVRTLVRSGELKAFRVGRQIRIRPEAVALYEDRQEIAHQAGPDAAEIGRLIRPLPR